MKNDKTRYNPHISPRTDRSKIESPLEELFIEQLEKHLNGKVEIIPQYEVLTNAGRFRLDFLIEINSEKIGLECDGKEFHDEWRDEWRDALILGNNQVDTIYRFRGKDLVCFINDCIHVIYHYDRQIFNERYEEIYSQLITEELLDYFNENPNFKNEENNFNLRSTDEYGKKIGWLNVKILRRSKNDKKSHWNELYAFSKNYSGLNIDQIIKEREKSWPKF